jgi:hypothetical protein
MIIATVRCLLCDAEMVPDQAVARVTHHYDPPTVTDLVRFRCHTPDCGNEVIVEGT